MATPEQDIKKDIKDFITSKMGFWSSVKGGAHSKLGDPDIVACYRKIYIGIEGKTDEGKLNGWQELRRDQILEAGGLWTLARSVEDVETVLDRIDTVIARIESLTGMKWDDLWDVQNSG